MLQTLNIPSTPLPEVPSAPPGAAGTPGDAGERAEFAQLLREAKTIEPEARHDEPTPSAGPTRTDTRLRPDAARGAQAHKAHDTRHRPTDVDAVDMTDADALDLAHAVKRDAANDAPLSDVCELAHPAPATDDDIRTAAPAADPAPPVPMQVSERLQAQAAQLPPPAMADERNLGAQMPRRIGTREPRAPARADAACAAHAALAAQADASAAAATTAADPALAHTQDAAFDIALRQAAGGRTTSAPLFDRLPLESTPALAQATAFARDLQQVQTAHAGATAEAALHPAIDEPGFAPALGAQVALWVKDGVQEARLQLHPAEMGPVSVQIALDGLAAHIDFTAAVAATRESIEQSLPALAAALRESGFTLAGGGVFGRSGQGAGEPGRDRTPEGRGHGTRGHAAIGSAGTDDDAALRPRRWSRSLVDVYA
jgi:flagellar hook-length control protein FliK